MKKTLLVLVAVMAMNLGYSQAKKQLSFGLVGALLEFPVGSAITVGPAAYTSLDFEYITLGAKANYYFDDLFGLPAAWDVYGGANAGFGLALDSDKNDSELDLGLQVGGRWFWSDKWGVYLEFGGGKLGGNAGIGVTMVL